jgi:hypothetical protein
MAKFHLLDPFYDESHRGRLLAEGRYSIVTTFVELLI